MGGAYADCSDWGEWLGHCSMNAEVLASNLRLHGFVLVNTITILDQLGKIHLWSINHVGLAWIQSQDLSIVRPVS